MQNVGLHQQAGFLGRRLIFMHISRHVMQARARSQPQLTSYASLGGVLRAFSEGVPKGRIVIGSCWDARGVIASGYCRDASGHMVSAGM